MNETIYSINWKRRNSNLIDKGVISNGIRNIKPLKQKNVNVHNLTALHTKNGWSHIINLKAVNYKEENKHDDFIFPELYYNSNYNLPYNSDCRYKRTKTQNKFASTAKNYFSKFKINQEHSKLPETSIKKETIEAKEKNEEKPKKTLRLSFSTQNITSKITQAIFSNPNPIEHSPKTKNAITKNNNISSNNSNAILSKEISPVNSYRTTTNNFYNKSIANKNTIKNLIKRVIENNKKQEENKNKEQLKDIGRDFANNNQMRKTSNNFYRSKSTSDPPNKEQCDDISSFPSLELTITNLIEWKKHEELWYNIKSINFLNYELCKYLYPPNYQDVLIGTYLILNNKTLNFDLGQNLKFSSNSNYNIKATLIINNAIKHPEIEIKKWKIAYKKVILRWHPDKLSSFLNEVHCLDDSQKRLLSKKSTLVINSMNSVYKKISEVLKTIIHRRKTKNK